MVLSLRYTVHGYEGKGYLVSRVTWYMIPEVLGYRVRGIVSHCPMPKR